MGKRLKKQSKKLAIAIIWKGKKRLEVLGKNLEKREKKNPIRKLLRGPAKETFRIPFRGFLKKKGLTGTGFAQPIKGPLPRVAIKRKNGTKTVPIGSMWAKGLRVNLPSIFAVGSPSESAASP